MAGGTQLCTAAKHVLDRPAGTTNPARAPLVPTPLTFGCSFLLAGCAAASFFYRKKLSPELFQCLLAASLTKQGAPSSSLGDLRLDDLRGLFQPFPT